MFFIRTCYTQRQERDLWGLWLLSEIWVQLVLEEANQKLLTGQLLTHDACDEKKAQIPEESDDCIG